jgi:ribose 1,5-bisphosphokinase
VRIAQRTITRPAELGAEPHRPVTDEEFARCEARDEFAMVWRANGHAYGIGAEICAWLAAGDTVVVNGSRAYASHAANLFPQIEIVLVSAAAGILRGRLRMRGREDAGAAEARMARLADGSALLSHAHHEILNEGELDQAGERLLALLLSRSPKPAF